MVSIIILSYNTHALLSTCLQSVFKHLKDLPFEVIVVDNASSDQSVHMVKTKFPKVKVIECTENLGFGKGINRGAKEARGEYLLFLNSDTQFTDDSFSKMVSFLEVKKHHRVGVVGGKLKNSGDSSSFSHNSFYTLPKTFALLFLGQKNEKRLYKPTKVDWVSGGYMLVLKEAFDLVKGFDKGYFMYIEDMDLCYRLLKKGYKTYYFPDAAVKHIGQGSSNRSFAIIQIYKGLLYFYRKHNSVFSYYLLKLFLLVKAVGSIVVGIILRREYLTRTYRQALTSII